MKTSILVSALVLWGCTTPEQEPKVGHIYACSIDRAWESVERAVREMNYSTREDRLGEGGGILRAWSVEAGELYVRAIPLWEGTTLVSVAAPNGDRDTEEAFLGRIDADLRPPSASGRPVPTSLH